MNKGHPATTRGKQENSNPKMKAQVKLRKKGKLVRKLVIFGDQTARTECSRHFCASKKMLTKRGPLRGAQ